VWEVGGAGRPANSTLIRFFDHLVVAYFFGPPCMSRPEGPSRRRGSILGKEPARMSGECCKLPTGFGAISLFWKLFAYEIDKNKSGNFEEMYSTSIVCNNCNCNNNCT